VCPPGPMDTGPSPLGSKGPGRTSKLQAATILPPTVNESRSIRHSSVYLSSSSLLSSSSNFFSSILHDQVSPSEPANNAPSSTSNSKRNLKANIAVNITSSDCVNRVMAVFVFVPSLVPMSACAGIGARLIEVAMIIWKVSAPRRLGVPM